MVQPKYSPQEALERIKLFMKYDSNKTLNENKKLISEQTDRNDPNYQLATAIWKTVGGAGTDASGFLENIKKIKSVDQFNKVNTFIERLNNNLTIDDWINDDFDEDDTEEVKGIISHLKSIGVNATAKFGSTGKFKENSFEISTTTPTPPTPEKGEVSQRQKNINNTWCSVKNGVIVNPASSQNNVKWEDFVKTFSITDEEIKIAKSSCSKKDGKSTKKVQPTIPSELKNIEGVKKFQDWLDDNHPGWATGYTDGKLSRGKGYGRFGQRTSKAWGSHKNEYLKGETKTVVNTNPYADFTSAEVESDNTVTPVED